jgi:AcrR family transcriptional regulator
MVRKRLSRADQKARTRQAIVAAATRLFLRQGIDGTSLEAVAAKVGLTKGAVYANFPSKAALIEAVAEIGASTVNLLDVLLRGDLSLRARLQRLGRDVAKSGLTRELVLLDLEYVIYAARNRRWGRVSRQRMRSDLRAFASRFRAVNVARREKPLIEEETMLYLLNIVCRGIIQELTVDAQALAASEVEAMFGALAGRRER